MISVVIRNKNESQYLKKVLHILDTLYKEDIDEIILVDNLSTDNSVDIAKKYQCKIVSITNFTYGRAINLGIEAANNNYILLLSAHTIPIGNHFFKSTLAFLKTKKDVAGLRYINSFNNYERALKNNFTVKDPLKFGLMAACCIVVKSVWQQHKVNEELGFSEDKEWSHRVINDGFKIYDFNETFFYFINRSKASLINRHKNETLANHLLFNTKPPSRIKVLLSLIKKIVFTNTKTYFNLINTDIKRAHSMFKVIKTFNKTSKYGN